MKFIPVIVKVVIVRVPSVTCNTRYERGLSIEENAQLLIVNVLSLEINAPGESLNEGREKLMNVNDVSIEITIAAVSSQAVGMTVTDVSVVCETFHVFVFILTCAAHENPFIGLMCLVAVPGNRTFNSFFIVLHGYSWCPHPEKSLPEGPTNPGLANVARNGRRSTGCVTPISIP